jgi:hypothetical protein
MKHIKKSSTPKSLQYDHLQGNPLDPSQHPATNLPSPQGGQFNGEAPFQNLSPPSNAIDYDNMAD